MSPFGDVVLDPGHDGAVHLLLVPHVQLVRGDDLHQLVDRQQQELFTLHHLAGEGQGRGFRRGANTVSTHTTTLTNEDAFAE